MENKKYEMFCVCTKYLHSFRRKRKCLCALAQTHTYFLYIYICIQIYFYFYLHFYNGRFFFVWKRFWSFLMKIMCVPLFVLDSHVLESRTLCMSVYVRICLSFSFSQILCICIKMLWMRVLLYGVSVCLWFLVDLKWIGIENATLCAIPYTTVRSLSFSFYTRRTILNANTQCIWNAIERWHKICKMLNAVCAVFFLSILSVFINCSVEKKELSSIWMCRMRCMHDAITCMRFLHYYTPSHSP